MPTISADFHFMTIMSLFYINEKYLFSDCISISTRIIAMGNCVGSTPSYFDEDEEYQYESYSHNVQLSQKNFVFLCLDVFGTPESSKLKTSFKGTFTNFSAFNGEKRLMDQIKSTQGHKYVIIILGEVREHTMEYLVKNSNVVAIYLCVEYPEYDQLPQSPKIKGYFDNYIELEEGISNDFRAN
jgi:hypothetical protein